MDWKLEIGDELVPGRLIQAPLGGGVRYQAFLTWNEELLCPTVVKVLRPDALDSPQARRSIAREGRLLRKIDHPYFLRLLAMDATGPRPFLEMEFLDGPRLSTLIRRHGILLGEQLFPLGRQLAAALHFMHTLKVVHLDVKPRNIIMGPVVRLIDLSIARRFDQIPLLRSPIGTDAYMAPEQCDRERLPMIAPATDVWGLGVTMYEAASRTRPFPKPKKDGTDEERWPQMVLNPAPLPRRVPSRVSEAIMACLSHDAARRPTALELFDTFDRLAADHGRGRRRLKGR